MIADYTPTTDKVRDAYIRGMRTAFIASAGEHHEEFTRWLAAHDAVVAANALREAAAELETKQVYSRNSIGWIPTNSLIGATNVLRHKADALTPTTTETKDK
jgi:hypothetical protein